MPFIDVKCNCALGKEEAVQLKAALGKAIELIPGKSESSLMLQFIEHAQLWFGGSDEKKLAFVNVMLYGTAQASHCQACSQEIIQALESVLHLDKVYVKYEEVTNWFWN